MSKIITDENQLNTEVDDLVTEDYALEVLGLKNPADFRRFSRSFMKLAKIVKGIDESNNNKLDKGGYNGTAKNLNDELSKKATKAQLGRIIIGKGLSVDSSGRASIVSKNDGITVNENDFQLNTVDNTTTDSGTKPLSARQGKKLEENKQNKNDSALLTTAKNIVGAINELFSGKANKAHSHGNSEITDIDASKIKTGTIDISRLPQTALERCIVVADDTARFRLTKSQVQVGDSVKVTSPDNLMYIVVDDNKLNQEAGYVAYSAAVKWETIKDKPSTFPPSSHTQDWSTITGKPSSFTPSSHTHTKNQITDFPSSLKNPSALTIQANGATLGSYDGSAAKTFDITASNVGASPSNHNHDSTYSKTSHTHTAGQVGAYTKGEIDTKFKNLINNSATNHVQIGSLKICWGKDSVGPRSTKKVTFPIKFNITCIPVVTGYSSSGSGPYCRGMGINSYDLSSMVVSNISEETVSYWSSFTYIVIGY